MFQLGPLAIFGVLYARRVRTLAEDGHPVPGWRQACFYGGFVVIAAALTSLGSASQDLLCVHMIEHLLLGDIAALLIVLGPDRAADRADPAHPLLRSPARARASRWSPSRCGRSTCTRGTCRSSTKPRCATPGVHALEHAMFLGFGINMWMCLFGPLPMPRWFGNLGKLIYIVAVRLAGTVLGNIFLWSGTIFYPFYIHGEAHFHISPLADQNIAGAIMMVEESILTLGLFCWLFLRTAREGEERQELLDYAQRAAASS